MTDYKNPTCRGCLILGTGCGTCEKCIEQKAEMIASGKQPIKRRDHIHCISKELGKSYCGRNISMDFSFTGLEHATAAIKEETRIQPCEDCIKVAHG